MFDAHRLIARDGVEGARRSASTKFERTCVDAAAAVLDRGAGHDEILYAGPEAVCLPHRRLDGKQDAWLCTRNIGASSFRLESGLGPDRAPAGVPFGSKGRLLLIYLHDAAVRGASAIVDVGVPMRAWARRLGGEPGGMTNRCLADQLARIAACRARIVERNLTAGVTHEGPFIDKVVRRDAAGAPDRVRLNRSFVDFAASTTIPIRSVALGQIGDNGWAIDLYVWLSWQLPGLTESLRVDWRTFVLGFDSGYKHHRQMKATSVAYLPLVAAIYPEARFEVTADHLVLHPSPPPAPTTAA